MTQPKDLSKFDGMNYDELVAYAQKNKQVTSKKDFISNVLSKIRQCIATPQGKGETYAALVNSKEGPTLWKVNLGGKKEYKYDNTAKRYYYATIASTKFYVYNKNTASWIEYPTTFWGIYVPDFIKNLTVRELDKRGVYYPEGCNQATKPYSDYPRTYGSKWDSELKDWLESEI